MEELLANLEMEGDRSHEITHLAGSEAEMGLELVIISKEIQDLKTEIKGALCTFGETLRSNVRKDFFF